jgi:DNA repair protein RadC
LALDVVQQIVGRQQEHFVCISLNGANEVIEKRVVTVGLLDRTQVHSREVFANVIAPLRSSSPTTIRAVAASQR